MTTDSALQPFVTICFTRLPCVAPQAALTADERKAVEAVLRDIG
jgi:hypothetical protein